MGRNIFPLSIIIRSTRNASEQAGKRPACLQNRLTNPLEMPYRWQQNGSQKKASATLNRRLAHLGCKAIEDTDDCKERADTEERERERHRPTGTGQDRKIPVVSTHLPAAASL